MTPARCAVILGTSALALTALVAAPAAATPAVGAVVADRGAASQAGTPAVASAASTPARPPGREWPSFAYDGALRELVLFGGDDLLAANASGGFRGTWTRTGTTWTKQHPSNSPSGRSGAAMAYDAATRQLLLFGGSSPGGGVDAQTWVWTGSNWRRLYPAVSPRARADANLVYDAASRELLLFGGYQGRTYGYQDRVYFGDTWTWTGRTWHRVHPASSPAARTGASMVYDAATRTVILFGSGGGYAGSDMTSMWGWNGRTWRKLRSTSPIGAGFAWQAAYDPASKQLLIFGAGGDRYPPPDWLWVWTGHSWRKLHPTASPQGRELGSMIYDRSTRQLVLFGGSGTPPSSYPDSTWAWNGSTWHLG